MTFDESKHKRDGQGQFTHTSVGSWASKAAEQLGQRNRVDATRATAKAGQTPPGFEAAKARAKHLWNIPDRKKGIERTDAEQAELDELEAAFAAYRDQLGLRRSNLSGLMHQDERGMQYTEHGEYLGQVTDKAPAALRRGYERVGEHPAGVGSLKGGPDQYLTPSIHPQAGGLWINPADPGTKHAPRYLNDLGHTVSSLLPSTRRSEWRKSELRSRRLEGEFGQAENVSIETVWRGKRSAGRMGYDMVNREGPVDEFLAYMKRAKARAKVEAAPKQRVRRTPKGTQVDGWMGTVSARMGQKGNGRG